MQSYTITKTQLPANWPAIPSLSIDQFPWYESGNQQATQIKLAYTDKALLIHIEAEDSYSYAQQTELNHMLICEDSCVEFFFSPSGQLGSHYINLEINCCGTLHLAYGPDRHSRKFIPLELAAEIDRDCSIKSPVKIESTDDQHWSAQITLPFATIERFTNETLNPNKWFANFYRCGGRTEPQYAAWNMIDSKEPDYHRPESFGELFFDK